MLLWAIGEYVSYWLLVCYRGIYVFVDFSSHKL